VRARQHILDEPLVAGNVYEAYANILKIKLGKTQINRDPAPLLLRQTIRIHTRQRTHERSLSMIYVPGCADDN
jgi:hypothetical protein